jgi:divalent metal cation (Fe/Co/Zn/Cd) transporter
MSDVTNQKPDESVPAGKGRRGNYPSLTGGLILILLGVLFLLTEMGRIGWANWWAYFLVGLGGIFLLEALIRAFSPEGRKGAGGRVIAGLILAVIGGAHLVGFEEWWPLILIAVGVGVLISGFLRKK